MRTDQVDTDSVRRKRVCSGTAAHRFTTLETMWVDPEERQVLKRNGRVESLSISKLRLALVRAAPVKEHEIPPKDVDAFIDRVLRSLPTEDPIPTELIGRLVLQSLVSPNPDVECARARFALASQRRASDEGSTSQIGAFADWLEQHYPESCIASAEVAPQRVVKRQRTQEPQHFNADQLARSVALVAKGRSADPDAVASYADDVANRVVARLAGQPIVTSGQIAAEVLQILRAEDPIAYLRYAAAVKGFRGAEDFWWESRALLNKPGLPTPHPADSQARKTK